MWHVWDTPMPIEWEAGRAQQPVWTFWRREKLPAPAEIRTPDRPARSLVGIPITQPGFPNHQILSLYFFIELYSTPDILRNSDSIQDIHVFVTTEVNYSISVAHDNWSFFEIISNFISRVHSEPAGQTNVHSKTSGCSRLLKSYYLVHNAKICHWSSKTDVIRPWWC
jgi:hypothetical protein